MEGLDSSVLQNEVLPTEPPSLKKQTCILSLKVFDWCVKPISETDCFAIPAACNPPVPSNLSVEYRIVSLTATIVAQTPGPGGIHTVTARVDKVKEITILESEVPRVVRCTFTVSATSFHTTSLFAPPGPRSRSR